MENGTAGCRVNGCVEPSTPGSYQLCYKHDGARRAFEGARALSGGAMSKAEHRQRHADLHRNLDELVADFLTHNRQKRPSNTTLMELMQWSHEQTIHPTEPSGI